MRPGFPPGGMLPPPGMVPPPGMFPPPMPPGGQQQSLNSVNESTLHLLRWLKLAIMSINCSAGMMPPPMMGGPPPGPPMAMMPPPRAPPQR